MIAEISVLALWTARPFVTRDEDNRIVDSLFNEGGAFHGTRLTLNVLGNGALKENIVTLTVRPVLPC
jgi:hypothetical protein